MNLEMEFGLLWLVLSKLWKIREKFFVIWEVF